MSSEPTGRAEHTHDEHAQIMQWANDMHKLAERIRAANCSRSKISREDLLRALQQCGEKARRCKTHGIPWPFPGSDGAFAAYDGGAVGVVVDALIESDPAIVEGREDSGRARLLQEEIGALEGPEPWLARAIFRAIDTRRGGLLRTLLGRPEAEACLERARKSADMAVDRAYFALAHIWGHLGPKSPLVPPLRDILAAMEGSPLLGKTLARISREHPHGCWSAA